MANPNSLSGAQATYPRHFDQSRFAHPRIVLNILMQPEIDHIGPEVNSALSIAILNEVCADLPFEVTPLYLRHADGLGRSLFPVYRRLEVDE